MKKIKNIYKFITLNIKWGVKKMKICGKKLIAGAAALAMAMACSPIGGFATENSVLITNIEILNDGADTAVASYAATDSGIKLTTAQLMRVTAELKDSTPANIAGEISFLSNFGGENVTLDNSTIQYVDQQTYDGATAVTITFRPRTTITDNGIGTFVAKAGGTDVATAATFNYTVEAPKSNMTADQNSKEITVGENVTFTLTPDSSLAISNLKVKEGTNDITVSFAENVITIPADALTMGTHTFVISADGYNDISVTVVVKAKPQETIDPSDTDDVNNGIQSALTPEPAQSDDGSFTFTDKITGTSETVYTIDYSVSNEDAQKVDIAGSKITLKNGVFAAKVQLTAKVADVTETKQVYLIPKDVTVSYGNLELISTGDGKDAFAPANVANQEAFMEVVNTNTSSILAARTEALNLTLKPETYANNPIALDAIDFDYDGTVVLAEYRIFKLMLENDSIHNFAAVNSARAKYTKPSGN